MGVVSQLVFKVWLCVCQLGTEVRLRGIASSRQALISLDVFNPNALLLSGSVFGGPLPLLRALQVLSKQEEELGLAQSLQPEGEPLPTSAHVGIKGVALLLPGSMDIQKGPLPKVLSGLTLSIATSEISGLASRM